MPDFAPYGLFICSAYTLSFMALGIFSACCFWEHYRMRRDLRKEELRHD